MTDHRATDLSYGHLGEATYDIEESQWAFSIDHSRDQVLQQVLPFSLCQPPSVQNAPQTSKKPSNVARSQLKYLTSSRPETFPARIIASVLSRTDSLSGQHPVGNGQLLSVGGAVNVEHLPGYRTESIIAMPHGEAGHTLRLLRPNKEKHGWGKRSSVGIAMLDAGSSDCGHWTGIGGTIHQIIFADDGNVSSTWLAVRQAFVTTIFRPMYYDSPVPSVGPIGHGTMHPPSRLGANPVAVLTAERTGSVQHVDVAFNPYYARQFSVIDEVGSWSIWDIEGRTRKRSTLELVAGKSGHIYDGYVHDPTLKEPGTADGWHRLLWASNVSTLVVCSRRHIAVFDVKSKPTRLQSIDILPASSTDWVLDMKRSPSNLSNLFVLTSSRIFWVAIIAPEENKDGEFRIRIISSYRHFRDPNDTSMKLTVPNDDSDVSVLISSGMSRLVNFYLFSTNADGNSSSPNSSQGSFTFNGNLNGQAADDFEGLQSVYFLGAALTSISSFPSGPELEILQKGLKYYQVFVLSANFGLCSTLCSVNNAMQDIQIGAPDSKNLLRKGRHVDPRHALADVFVVPDGNLDEETATLGRVNSRRLSQSAATKVEPQGEMRFRIDWRTVFQQALVEKSLSPNLQEQIPPEVKTMAKLLKNIANHILEGEETKSFPMSSFFELSQIPEISEELEQASPVLQKFLETLLLDQESDSTVDLVLSSLTSCPGISFPRTEGTQFSSLTQVYDQVGDQWMASLPLKVSNLSRLAKFKTARKIAVELCLASIAVSLREKSSHMVELSEPEIEEFSLPILSKISELREESPPFPSSQLDQSPSQDPGFTLPTPTRTASLYSHDSATSGDSEDPAISRLRQYATSVKLPSSIGRYPLLAQWPAVPGANPDQYKWEPSQKASLEDDDQEGDSHRKRRDEARRRKRTERFLNQKGTTMAEPASSSQPAFIPFGSQPEVAHHAASSQTVDDLPMTQPDRGLFGSRSAKLGKKKQKKRRAAGF